MDDKASGCPNLMVTVSAQTRPFFFRISKGNVQLKTFDVLSLQRRVQRGLQRWRNPHREDKKVYVCIGQRKWFLKLW